MDLHLWTEPCTYRARSGLRTPLEGRRPESQREFGLRPRASWPKSCSSEHSKRTFPPDGWWPTPSTERREAYEGGWKSGDDGTCWRCPLPRASTTTDANGRLAQ